MSMNVGFNSQQNNRVGFSAKKPKIPHISTEEFQAIMDKCNLRLSYNQNMINPYSDKFYFKIIDVNKPTEVSKKGLLGRIKSFLFGEKLENRPIGHCQLPANPEVIVKKDGKIKSLLFERAYDFQEGLNKIVQNISRGDELFSRLGEGSPEKFITKIPDVGPLQTSKLKEYI